MFLPKILFKYILWAIVFFVDVLYLGKYFRHLVLGWVHRLDLHEIGVLLELFGKLLLPLLVLIGC